MFSTANYRRHRSLALLHVMTLEQLVRLCSGDTDCRLHFGVGVGASAERSARNDYVDLDMDVHE